MNWVYDPAPPASRRATVDFSDTPVNASDTPASAIISASPGAPLASPHPKKSRRRRRRRNRRSANQNSAPRSAAPVTPDERWANKNSASQRATQPQSAASDPSQMMSTPVYQHQSFHSSHLSQPHFPAANGNSAFQSGLDHCRFPGLYKPAHPDPSQSSVSSTASGGHEIRSAKEMAITIHVPDTETNRRIFSTPLNKEKKEVLARSLMKGNTKLTWEPPSVKRETLLLAIQRKQVPLDTVRFRMTSMEEYMHLNEGSRKAKTTS